MLQGQLISGGWSESIEFDPQARARVAYRVDSSEVGKRRNLTTFDDDKTQSAIRFLLRLDVAMEQRDAVIHEAVMYALNGVFAANIPTVLGLNVTMAKRATFKCPQRSASYPKEWPREFPDKKYTTYYTLNDSTLVDLIETLIEASDVYADANYLEAARSRGDFCY